MNKFQYLLIACALVSACAQAPGKLPADYSSVNAARSLSDGDFLSADLELDCVAISSERTQVEERSRLADDFIKSKRRQNQTAGYLAALFLLPIVAVDTTEKQLATIAQNQKRLDTLLALSRYRGCA